MCGVFCVCHLANTLTLPGNNDWPNEFGPTISVGSNSFDQMVIYLTMLTQTSL
jgi:hypothetical protein